MKAERQLLLGHCWAEHGQAAERDAMPQLVEWEQSPRHGSRPLPSLHLTTKTSGTSNEEHQAHPNVSSLVCNFREEKWLAEPAQKLSLQGIRTADGMVSVTTVLLCKKHFSLYCLLCFFREASWINPSHAFPCCFSDPHLSPLSLNVLVLLLGL